MTVSHPTPQPKTTVYDVAEHLRTPDEMAAYLDAWLAEAPDDAQGIARALGNITKAQGIWPVAKALGVQLHVHAAPVDA